VGLCAPPANNYVAMVSTASNNYSFHSYLVVAQSNGNAHLMFNFRGDPHASWYLDDVSLRSVNGSNSSELLIDGNFESFPIGWVAGCWGECSAGTYGSLIYLSCRSNFRCYNSGCQGGYDSLTQSVSLSKNVAYNLSFWLYLNTGGGPAPMAYVSFD
jgi:hypothetical protein